MARIVLEHGIGQEQKSAASLEAEWPPSLAGGLRMAGYPGLADQVWRHAEPGTVRMAFCDDLFLTAGQQGTDLARHSRGDLDASALNSRPRKTLGWRTPAEALNDHQLSLRSSGVATTR